MYNGLTWDEINVIGNFNDAMEKLEQQRPKICRKHKPINKKDQFNTFISWQAEAERRTKLGHKQEQCPKCLRWFWLDEL